MKNTHKLITLFLIFSLFIAEGCKRKNEPTAINNAFEIFNNQTLVLDSTTSNHLKFVKQQDSVLILKKDSILYAFDIEKINAVFSNDVYVFYDINKEDFSELKLKKFNESEELKTKKEYLSHKKNAIENTIVFIEQDFNCADKYNLNEGSFDLTNTIQKNYIQYNVADFKFKPINEDVALFVEDNCKNISIKVLAILTIDSTKGNIIFKPLKIELFNKNNNSKIDGVGILQNSLNKTEITTIKNKKSNANSHNSNTNKKVSNLDLSNDRKEFQNHKTNTTIDSALHYSIRALKYGITKPKELEFEDSRPLGGVGALDLNTNLSEDKKALLNDLKLLDEANARLGNTSQRTHAVGDLDLENINIVKQDVNSTSNQQQNWWKKINDEDLIWFLIILVGTMTLFFFIIKSSIKKNKGVRKNNGKTKGNETTIKPPPPTNPVNGVKKPKNLAITFIDSEIEDQNKVKYIGYEPSAEFEQQEPYNYPMVFMPKPNSVIKFPRKGKQGFKGYSEDILKKHLFIHFNKTFQLFDDRFVLYKSHRNPFEPDFALIDENNDINLFIDIEIDEPYDGITRQPIHYTNYNKQRDTFFKNRGWIVIRFAEYQIVKNTLGCCKFIAEVVASVNPNFSINESLKSAQNLNLIKQWSKEDAIQWAKENYREKYLNIVSFTEHENRSILTNLIETKIGKEIESHVNDKPDDLTEKEALITRAINYGNFISCKIKMDDFYTVIKPKYTDKNELVGYCYLKNAEIKLSIGKIENIIIREKPFLHKLKKEIGVEQVKKFFTKFIGSKNPVRIKYTKSDFGTTIMDLETDELLVTDEDRDSLRTITDFDIVSNKHNAAKIAEFKLNDEDYISGFCHKQNELRTFKYDRINELEVLNI